MAVVSALGALAQDDLLATERTESATGKGRPAYDSALDTETVLSALDDADGVGSYVERSRTTG